MSKEIIERHFNGIISYENILDTDGIGAQFRITMQNNTYIWFTFKIIYFQKNFIIIVFLENIKLFI